MPKVTEFPVKLKAGILMCLFLIISFCLVGYTIALSIFLAVIGGVACGLVVTWWNNNEIPQKVKETASEPAKVKENQPKLVKLELPKQPEKNVKSPNKNTAKAVTLFNWLFRK
jgi:hypothetical protein